MQSRQWSKLQVPISAAQQVSLYQTVLALTPAQQLHSCAQTLLSYCM